MAPRRRRARSTRVTIEDEALTVQWEHLLLDHYKAPVLDAALAEQPLVIDFRVLEKHKPDMADDLLARPRQVLDAITDASKRLNVVTPNDAPFSGLPVRVIGLPDTTRMPIRALRARHIGRLLSLDCLVRRARDPRPMVSVAVYHALCCNNVFQVPQLDFGHIQEPLECPENQGGCGKSIGFLLDLDQSILVDVQPIEVQEPPDLLHGGEQPSRLDLFLAEDLCGQVKVGDRITANGYLLPIPKKQGTNTNVVANVRFTVAGLELGPQPQDEVSLSPDEEARVKSLAANPQVYDQLTQSIAPTIHGLQAEKLAIVLQSFGGITKLLPDGMRIRGDIHILLIGDPGVAKSQLLRYAARLSTRGVYANGKSSSAAGLTAIAVQEEEGRWMYEAGALVLADGGFAAIDELDKMDEKDRSAMHEALEQGTVSVSKAGGNVIFNSRCCVLAAANPTQGRFDPRFGVISEQVDLEPPLLSRFDLIFPLVDKPNRDKDAALAEHVLRIHSAGAIRAYRAYYGDVGTWTAQQEEEAFHGVEPIIPPELLRKYIALAKRTVYPVAGAAVREAVKDWYVKLRSSAGEDGPIALTPRQLEAVERLAEASARVRLSSEVTMEDARRAWALFENFLSRMTGDGSGLFDLDKIVSGVSHSKRGLIVAVEAAIRELEATTGDTQGVNVADLKAKLLKEQRIDAADVDRELEELRRATKVFFPRNGWVRIT